MPTGEMLPPQIDYRRRALDNAHLSGCLNLSDLRRTAGVVLGDSGDRIAVSIDLGEDAQRRVVLSGQVQTTLVMACQRCLEPTRQTIDTSIGGIVVASDEAAADVPRDAEPILARGDTLDLHALIDDELLLALPMTVQCDRPECQAAYDRAPPAQRQSHSADKPNPFAALKSLKSDDSARY